MPDLSTARSIAFGTDDQSTKQVFPENKGTPQFVPLFHLNTPRGPYTRTHVTGKEFAGKFGIEGLQPTSKYGNFATVTASKIAANSSFVVQRLRGKIDVNGDGSTIVDANIAGLVIYISIKHTPVAAPQLRYKRDAVTGKIVKDNVGNDTFEVTTLSSGSYEVGVTTLETTDTAGATVVTGTDGKTVSYPVIGLSAEAHGDWYNNIGVTLTPNIESDLNTDVWDADKVLTYTLKVYDKSTGTKKLVTTVVGDSGLEFALKPNSSHPVTGKGLSLNFNFPNVYGNDVNPLLPLKPYIFDKGFKLYDTSLLQVQLLAMWVDEIAATVGTQTWTDFGTVDEAIPADVQTASIKYKWAMNLFTLKNTKGIRYEAIRPMDTTFATVVAPLKLISISPNTTVYLANGQDGELTDAQFETAVVADMADYANTDHQVQSIPLNKETIIIDPGYTMDTKLKLAPFIANRRNTMIGFSTHVFNEANSFNTTAQDTANASTLLSTLALFLESDEFNTPSMRAFIVMGSGFTIDGNYPYRVPLVMDYAIKMAKYTAALNGKRNGTFAFSRQSGNIISELFDIEPKYLPDSALDTIHKAGLIRPDNNDLLEFFYPSHQTIYTNDTSVLNNVLTVQAITTLTTINDIIWRRYSGADDLNNVELKIAVEEDFNELVNDIFDNNYTVVPEVFFTERDINLGWIYRLKVKIYANNSKTQQYSHVIALRASEL